MATTATPILTEIEKLIRFAMSNAHCALNREFI